MFGWVGHVSKMHIIKSVEILQQLVAWQLALWGVVSHRCRLWSSLSRLLAFCLRWHSWGLHFLSCLSEGRVFSWHFLVWLRLFPVSARALIRQCPSAVSSHNTTFGSGPWPMELATLADPVLWVPCCSGLLLFPFMHTSFECPFVPQTGHGFLWVQHICSWWLPFRVSCRGACCDGCWKRRLGRTEENLT